MSKCDACLGVFGTKIILVVAKNADGWFEGSLEAGNGHGLFPGNYVEELGADEQEQSMA